MKYNQAFFKKRYLINGINENKLNKDYFDICKEDLETRLEYYNIEKHVGFDSYE